MDARNLGRVALAACLMAAGLPAVAGQPAPTQVGPAEGAGDGTRVAAFGTALGAGVLADLRGGDAQVVVEVDNQGRVEGNTASQVVAGDNRIDGGAFANAAGLTTVIQNSGSNVLIQNGTSVNVRFGGP